METEPVRLDIAKLIRTGDATAQAVADAVVAIWLRIDRDLAPIVGPAGVAALYRRSLHVCAKRHPALAPALGPSLRALDTEALRSVLHSESVASAATLGADLLQTFHELLSRMVGPSLTERLLRSVWNDIAGEPPAEDPQA